MLIGARCGQISNAVTRVLPALCLEQEAYCCTEVLSDTANFKSIMSYCFLP
jgi:hypothetical protein